MVNVIKLRKGLNINLIGKAKEEKKELEIPEEYALVPDDFVGVVPKVLVKQGDVVKVGDPLFENKSCSRVKFTSPVSGVVADVIRGERRKVLRIKIKADKEQQYVDFGKKEVESINKEEIIESLLNAGLFGYINQLPYAISTTPDTTPRAIFVSALRDMPLAADFEFELKGNENAFQTGLTALSKIAKTYLNIGKNQYSAVLKNVKNVELTEFDGPCPAGNVGVQINHIAPVNRGEVVWTVEPTAVIFIGRLFLTGKLNLMRTVAVAGSEILSPCYVDTLVGTPLSVILNKQLKKKDHIRIINGNPLTGKLSSLEDFLGAHTSEITVIPEGDDVNEFMGWILPRFRQFSMSRTYFSWLKGKSALYNLDARVKGGKRHMIMSGEYDKVLPMDIYGEYIIKAIIAGDIDKMEQLGIYEISPEDFALAEFVDSSKLPLQQIVRNGLDMIRKENS